jgi:ABC-2 type transport system ATP-binding protein
MEASGGSATANCIELQNVSMRFGELVVLRSLDLNIGCREIVAVIGENGVGKSTLLRICAGMVTPSGGQVVVHGRVGYCPQEGGLLDRLTADEHLDLFGRAAGMDRPTAQAQGHQVLDDLGFKDYRRECRHLSGGNRQKLNLALALLGERSVLLLDEPYQGFDRGTYVDFWDHVHTWRSQGRAVVVVTHLLTELYRVDRVIELKGARDEG